MFQTSCFPTMLLFAIILNCVQPAAGFTAAACTIKCQNLRGRNLCFNPCFTPGEPEFNVIQKHLKDPCSEERQYWQAFYKYAGRVLPAVGNCESKISGDVPGNQGLPDCVTAFQLRNMGRMMRCKMVQLDAICSNALDLMTDEEIMQLGRDASIDC